MCFILSHSHTTTLAYSFVRMLVPIKPSNLFPMSLCMVAPFSAPSSSQVSNASERRHGVHNYHHQHISINHRMRWMCTWNAWQATGKRQQVINDSFKSHVKHYKCPFLPLFFCVFFISSRFCPFSVRSHRWLEAPHLTRRTNNGVHNVF